MKRALFVLIPLAAAGIGAVIAITSPAVRSSQTPKQWQGHVVPFHLPVDAGMRSTPKTAGPKGIERAWPGGPRQSAMVEEEFAEEVVQPDGSTTLVPTPTPPTPSAALSPGGVLRIRMEGGNIWFHATDCGAATAGGLTKLGTLVQQAVATGTIAFELDPGGGEDAQLVVRAAAVCYANGAPALDLVAGASAFPGALQNTRSEDRSAPALPVVVNPRPTTHPLAATVTVILDGSAGAERMVWRHLGAPDELVTGEVLYGKLKALATRLPEPHNPSLSDLTVLLHVGEGADWAWTGAVIMECAKAGVWRIEAIAEPAAK